MKGNKLIAVLAGVLLVMVVVVILRDKVKPAEKPDKGFLVKLSALTEDSVKQISIVKGERNLSLKKETGGWQVGGYRADQALLSQLIGNIFKANGLELVAETSVQHQNLGVEEKIGAKMTLGDGVKQVVIIIGNSANGGYYVRHADEDNVYWIKELPVTASSLALDDWLDKTLTQVQETALKTINLTDKNGKTLKLKRIGGEWSRDEGQEVLDPEPLTPLLTTLAALKVQGLVTDEKKVNKTPVLMIDLETDNGTQTLKAFANGKDQYALESSDRAGKFSIDKATFDALNLDPKTLKPKPSPSPTPSV